MCQRDRRFLLFWSVLACIAIASVGAATPVHLTEAELAFIDSHREIRIGVDPRFVPFEFIGEDGSYEGVSADILELVAARTGLRFVHDPDLSWVDAVQGARDRSIDLLPTVGYTAARSQYLVFLEPHIHFQRSIVLRKSNRSISSFSDLRGRQVAVQRDSSHEGFLLAYPDIDLRLYDTVEQALLAVHRGDEIAFVGNEASSMYLSRSLGLTELQFIALTEGGEQDLHMAVRNDWPKLATIMQKALDSITDAEYDQILKRWIQYESRVDYKKLWQIAGVIATLVILVVAISLFWILRLKKAVKEKDAAQKQAQAADMEKSRFMARISHEVRTPLNGIKGMGYLLEKTRLDQTQVRYLQTIKSATQTMQVIINDILEYSKIEEGRITLESIPFVLDDVLQGSISLESWMIRQKGLGFRLTQGEDVPPYLIGDPTRIKQIITNLLHNAVKFTAEGSIELSLAATIADAHACTLTLTVSDTGIGMTEGQLKQVFKPFTQADETIARKYGGSGLGLSIVKNLVELLGGTIGVDSEPGRGSVFTVHLPMQIDTAGSEADKLRRKSIDFSSLHVLLVLSDGLLLERVSSLFDEYHIRFDTVSSAKLALQVLQGTHEYDLLAIEVESLSKLPPGYVDVIASQGAQGPKLLVFIHDETEEDAKSGNQEYCDLIMPLPIINSVLFNGLLQLFGDMSVRKDGVARTAKPHADPLHVLVVEDNPTNQVIAKELLQQAGHTVYIANDGKEGYELFMQHASDLDVILMDLHMDVMNGFESTRLIRLVNRHVPVIVLSADLMESVRARCEEAGATELVGKPYEPEVLLEKVQTHGSTYKSSRLSDHAVDFSLGLKRVGGDKRVYDLVLQSFITETKQTMMDLRDSLEAVDHEAATNLAHKCKGSCGSIGAMHAYELCIALQQQLQDPGYTNDDRLVKELLQELELVHLQAEAYLQVV